MQLPQNASLNFSYGKSIEDVLCKIYFPIFSDIESKVNETKYYMKNLVCHCLKTFALTYITCILEPQT